MENPHATSLPLLDEVKLQARVGRTSAFDKGFGCRPDASVRPGIGGPASESLRRTNPRESEGP